MVPKVEYCNWVFWEVIKKSQKYGVQRDCDDESSTEHEASRTYEFNESVTLVLNRGKSRNWKNYKASLQPRHQYYPPPFNSKCPNCGNYINGVNPYDDGETWIKL